MEQNTIANNTGTLEVSNGVLAHNLIKEAMELYNYSHIMIHADKDMHVIIGSNNLKESQELLQRATEHKTGNINLNIYSFSRSNH